MTRNECIEECVNIWNDLSLSEDERKELYGKKTKSI